MGMKPSVFIKICLIHICTGTTYSFIKRVTTVTAFTLLYAVNVHSQILFMIR